MLTHRRALVVLILVLLASLSACGFKLRGESQTSMPFKTIFLGFPPNSTLGVELSRNIRADGKTVIATNRKSAEAILEVVSPEQRGRAVLAMSQGQVSEYTLSYSFAFRVRDQQSPHRENHRRNHRLPRIRASRKIRPHPSSRCTRAARRARFCRPACQVQAGAS